LRDIKYLRGLLHRSAIDDREKISQLAYIHKPAPPRRIGVADR
jgi:hypothetical protein